MALTQVNANAIKDGAITTTIFSQNVSLSGPRISNVQIANSSWSILDDTAISLSGGYIIINGAGFQSGCAVLFDTTVATSVSVVSSAVLRVQVPALAANSYNVYVNNPDGGTAIGVNQLTSSGVPTWVTDSTLTTQVMNNAFSIQLNATGAVSYQLQTGSSLPSNTTLAANGLLTGNISGLLADTTYNFTVEAIDAENQESPRAFSMQVLIYGAPLSVEYLVVAGGGGGGPYIASTAAAGGGGGGGVLTGNTAVTSNQAYTIVIGGGGAAGAQGSVSYFRNSSNTDIAYCYGGGGGGNPGYGNASEGGPGTNGGSGGGAGCGQGGFNAQYPNRVGSGNVGGKGVYPGSSYINEPRQGYDGGNSSTGDTPGGGGGAGGPGLTNDGNGGNGIEWPTGSGEYFGGGGYGGYAYNGRTYTAGLGRNGGNAWDAGLAGVVKIRYPSTFLAAASTTGSPTITVGGGYRTYTFTSSGTITF